MGRPWGIYGAAVGYLWGGYGTAMGDLWDGYGVSVGWLWVAMGDLWGGYGVSMGPSPHRMNLERVSNEDKLRLCRKYYLGEPHSDP